MDDAMLDLMADGGGLRRRLDAYAEDRLSPDLGATTRMRSRVLAVAHRQSALTRSDVTLALVPDPIDLAEAATRAGPVTGRRAGRTVWRRGAAIVLAAGLATASLSGVVLAAKPGGGLYAARVWAETLVLPAGQPDRAIRELHRLRLRVAEIAQATADGDVAAASAALIEYERIVDQAAADADRVGDDVAAVALQQGVADNIDALTALQERLPAGGTQAVGGALARAIERSNDAIASIKPGNGHDGGGSNAGGNGGGNGVPGGPNVTAAPVTTDGPASTPTPKPTKTPKSEATPKPKARPKPDPTPKSTDEGVNPGGGGQGPGDKHGGERTPRPHPPGRGD